MRGSDLEVARIAVWARSVASGRVVVALAAVTLGVTQPAPAAEGVAPERRNWFDTPFGQAVDGLPDCPRPEGPLITESEMRSLAHARIERGTSCWLAKKCEDSNAYRRDHATVGVGGPDCTDNPAGDQIPHPYHPIEIGAD